MFLYWCQTQCIYPPSILERLAQRFHWSVVCCLWSFCYCYGFLCSLCISYKIYGFRPFMSLEIVCDFLLHIKDVFFLSTCRVSCLLLIVYGFLLTHSRSVLRFNVLSWWYLFIIFMFLHFLWKKYFLLSFPCLAKPCMLFTFTKHHIAFNLLWFPLKFWMEIICLLNLVVHIMLTCWWDVLLTFI